MFTLLGSCRINGIATNNNLNNVVSYTHNTKEAIQLWKYLKGELVIPAPYNRLCFRIGNDENRAVQYNPAWQILTEQSRAVIVEICSRKKYEHNGFHLHHLCVDKRTPEHTKFTAQSILDEHTVSRQTDQEILDDILELRRLVQRPLIVVTHYDAKVNGISIPERLILINLLEFIGRTFGIQVLNPSKLLSKHPQGEVLNHDLCHYTEIGQRLISTQLNSYIF